MGWREEIHVASSPYLTGYDLVVLACVFTGAAYDLFRTWLNCAGRRPDDVAEKTSAPRLALAYVPLELSFYSESAIVLRTMLGVLAMLRHRRTAKPSPSPSQ
jgi:hypothetical protein